MTETTHINPRRGARLISALQGLLVATLRAVRGGVVAILTDDRPACAWRQGPDHLYHATRSAFGKPR
jgi:hypothetical protein